MKGLVFNVNRFAVHDGPGIRVTFFLKGCPLSCFWCHNPEGIFPEPEMVLQRNRIGEREFSHYERMGREFSVSDVLSILDSEKIFIDSSGGGVTFSGGEPMLQHQFLLETLEACKMNGYHTAVDTSGYFAADYVDPVMRNTDLFLFDLKHMDPGKHTEFTGVSNIQIFSNLRRMLEGSTDILIRIPIIPGFNDDKDHLISLKQFLAEIYTERMKGINLLPYHRIGITKYSKLGKEYKMNGVNQPTQERMLELKELFSIEGLTATIGG